MRAIILAGGLGTRLRERVPLLPKPMAPVAGRPFLSYLLDRLVEHGIQTVTLSVGYRADAIQAFVGDDYRGMAISYAIELEPLGTGGGVALACRQAPDEEWLVLNGDTFVDLDYRALQDWYKQSPEDVAMVLRPEADVSRYGAVTTRQGRATGFVDKELQGPGLINAGIYVLRPAVFQRYGLEGRFSLENDLLKPYVAAEHPRVFETNGLFIDIGVPADYDRAQTLFSSTSPQSFRSS